MTAQLALVGGDADLFDYPVPKSERLDGHHFVKWQSQRWLSSELCLMATFEVKGMARDLFDLAQSQSPPGTLPFAIPVIARLLRVDATLFEGLCRHDYGPLHNWQPCRCDDGEVRRYHPVVLGQIMDAMTRRESRALLTGSAAARQRRKRLTDALARAGVDARVLEDAVFVERCDTWLAEHWQTSRTDRAYAAVLSVAAKEKWFTPHRGT